jgi:hypothetical protein
MAKTRLLLAFVSALALASAAHAVVINFDDVVIPPGSTVQPGNLYAAQGVTFSSGNMSPDLNAAVAVGDTFTLTGIQNGFIMLNNDNSVSPPNFAGAQSLGLQDTLMAFASPITSLSLHSDDTGESAQVIRLLALEATGNANEYRVVAFDEALDDATSEPGNLLSVNVAGGFSFALFQVTTEQEGFDDVTFPTAPEPGTWLLVVLGMAVLGSARRKR